MKLHRLNDARVVFECPGCQMAHCVAIGGDKQPIWGFNNDFEKPTFTPSIKVEWDVGKEHILKRCHSFVRDGKIQFLNDCTHELAGKTVDLPEWEEPA